MDHAVIIAPPVDYPAAYRLCPVCRAPLGIRCRVKNSRIVDGQPDGVSVDADRPHLLRKKRKIR